MPMYFDEENFAVLPNKQDRSIVADLANEILEKNGIVLTGRHLEDGSAVDFSTDKLITDTHSCIAFDMTEMRKFKPQKSKVKTNELKQQEMIEIQNRTIAQQKREIENLRGSNV